MQKMQEHFSALHCLKRLLLVPYALLHAILGVMQKSAFTQAPKFHSPLAMVNYLG